MNPFNPKNCLKTAALTAEDSLIIRQVAARSLWGRVPKAACDYYRHLISWENKETSKKYFSRQLLLNPPAYKAHYGDKDSYLKLLQSLDKFCEGTEFPESNIGGAADIDFTEIMRNVKWGR